MINQYRSAIISFSRLPQAAIVLANLAVATNLSPINLRVSHSCLGLHLINYVNVWPMCPWLHLIGQMFAS